MKTQPKGNKQQSQCNTQTYAKPALKKVNKRKSNPRCRSVYFTLAQTQECWGPNQPSSSLPPGAGHHSTSNPSPSRAPVMLPRSQPQPPFLPSPLSTVTSQLASIVRTRSSHSNTVDLRSSSVHTAHSNYLTDSNVTCTTRTTRLGQRRDSLMEKVSLPHL